MFRRILSIIANNNLKNIPLYLTNILFGGFITLSFAPFNFWPMAVLGLTGFFYSLHRQIATQKNAFKVGYCFGLGLFFSGLYWVFYSMQTAHTGVAISLLLTFIFCSLMALLPAFLATTYQRFFSASPLFSAISFAVLWVLFEWLRSWLFTGMPWLLLGYAHTDSLLKPLLTITGTFGVSFMIAFASASLTSAFFKPKSCYLNLPLLIALSASIFFIPVPSDDKTSDKISVTVIQGNVAQDDKWRFQHRVPTLLMYRDLTREHPDSDLIIWPETAMPVFQEDWINFIAAVDNTAKDEQQGLLTGILTSEGNSKESYKEYNSLLALGEAEGVYNKQHLVPFGEVLPFESILRGLIRFFDIPYSTFSSGADNQTLVKFREFKLATAICYEIAFAELTRLQAQHSQAIVTISNDAWFGTSIAPFQHLEIAQIRAIENGLPVIRATQNGISAIIDKNGKIIKKTKQFEKTSATAEITMSKAKTFYVQHGDSWLIVMLFIILGALTLINFIIKRKKIN